MARVCEGFIGNRIYSAYRTQCEFMLEEGALPAEVDAAITGFGFAMGPFAVTDLSGLDIAWRTRQRLAATRDPKARYSDVLDKLCEAGRLGKKAGKGWYSYPEGARRGVADDAVRAIIEDASRRKGITRVPMTPGRRSRPARSPPSSTRPSLLLRKALPIGRPMSIWSWSMATAFRRSTAARCSGRAANRAPRSTLHWMPWLRRSRHGFRRVDVGKVLDQFKA